MKAVIDSDCLIKLNKAGLLVTLAQRATLVIGPIVYQETVEDGKARGYADAVEIEAIVSQWIEQKRPRRNAHADRLLKGSLLGKGEQETLRLYYSEQADAIISDDRAFIRLLQSAGLGPVVLTAAACVRWLHGVRALSQAEAVAALNRLRPYINRVEYQTARAQLQGGTP